MPADSRRVALPCRGRSGPRPSPRCPCACPRSVPTGTDAWPLSGTKPGDGLLQRPRRGNFTNTSPADDVDVHALPRDRRERAGRADLAGVADAVARRRRPAPAFATAGQLSRASGTPSPSASGAAGAGGAGSGTGGAATVHAVGRRRRVQRCRSGRCIATVNVCAPTRARQRDGRGAGRRTPPPSSEHSKPRRRCWLPLQQRARPSASGQDLRVRLRDRAVGDVVDRERAAEVQSRRCSTICTERMSAP